MMNFLEQNKPPKNEIAQNDDDNKMNLTMSLEKTSRGVVQGSLMFSYFKSGSNLFSVYFMVLLFILTQLIVSFNDYFMQVL